MYNWFRLLLCCLLLVCHGSISATAAETLSSASSIASSAAPIKRVLILHSYHQSMPWTDGIHQAIVREFERSKIPVQMYVEYKDSIRFKPTPENQHALLEKLLAHSAIAPPDIIIVSDNDAFAFMLAHRHQIAPGKTLVFCGINNLKAEDIANDTNLTGVSETPSFYETLSLVTKLEPAVRHVLVIGDDTATFKGNRRGIEAAILKFSGKLVAEYSTETHIQKLEARLRHLDKNTVVLMAGKPTDDNGVSLSIPEANQRIAAASVVPVYSGWDFRLGQGALGGHLISGDAQGRAAGQLAIRLLQGESIHAIQRVAASPNVPMFDYLAMQRFGIPENLLPVDSVIINKPESFYEKNKTAVRAASAIIIALIIAVTILTFNIIERHRAEQDVKRLNAELLQQVSDLETINNELNAFTYSVSHDLRGPLRRISGFSEIVVRKYNDLLDEPGKALLYRICVGIANMSDMINSFLKIARASQDALVIAQVNLSFIAEQVMRELQRDAPERNVTVKITPNVYAEGDAKMLKIVLRNLLENAWKYTQHRENAVISFGVETGETPIYVVQDNGVGFEMQHADKLFKPFSRLHDGNLYEGTGIGLATCQRIINRHQGHIWTISQPGKSTRFYFTLPKKRKGDS